MLVSLRPICGRRLERISMSVGIFPYRLPSSCACNGAMFAQTSETDCEIFPNPRDEGLDSVRLDGA